MRDPRPAFFIAQGGGFVLAAALLAAAWWAVTEPPLVGLLGVDLDRIQRNSMLAMVPIVAAVVGPPAFLIGMTFAFVQRAVQHDLSQVGARVGWVQLANIAGNAAGAIVTGLVTLHWLGTAGALKLLAALSLLLMLGWLARGGWRRPPELAIGAACALSLVALPGNAEVWSRLHLVRPGQTMWWHEDRSGVSVYRAESGAGGLDGPFFIQGFAQGRIPFISIHQFLGAIGPLVHPDPRRVLVIGVGSGGTPWAAGVLPASAVRAIELVAPVIAVHRDIARAQPDGPSARMLSDPRWRIDEGDGRRLLAREAATYDVIEADALLPGGSLSGLLYSREFLQLARRRLAPGGLYVQWTPTCRSVATFKAAFPHTLLLLPARVMVGADSPVALDAEAVARRFADPAVSAHLSRLGADAGELGDLLRRVVRWSGGGTAIDAPLTDLRPRDEFFVTTGRREVTGRLPAPSDPDADAVVPGCPEFGRG
jgi:hypothetical protein